VKSLAETLVRGKNNFDLIRLLAALAVMFGHSFGIRGGDNFEWMLQFTHRESFGSLAVYAFFLVSGLLVSASYVKQAAPLRFVALRALRIWPAAVVCALVIGLFVGPIFTIATPAAYFANDFTQQWLLHNITLLGHVGGPLPGVFMHNHLGSLVNATAWTLPVELQCYVIVLVLGLFGVLTSRTGIAIAIGLLSVAFAYVVSHPSAHITLGSFFLLPIAYSFYPVPFFFLGMLLFTFRDRVKLHWAPAVLGTVAYLAFRNNEIGKFLLYPVFAYGVLWVASLRCLFPFQPRHDYSYGIYLYGFVVQQALTDIFPSWSNYLNVLIAIPITVLLAAISWHLVERPCLEVLRRAQVPVPLRSRAVAGSGA
jgi:peptidoglycan/LPS O-acetylase OafA/YrhL